MKIGVVCYPTYGGSGVLATELGLGLARRGHEIHFITYRRPARLGFFHENVFYHEVDSGADYPLFEFAPYETSLASKLVDVVENYGIDLLHVHYAVPHAAVAYMARKILISRGRYVPFVTTLHGTDITLVGSNPAFAPTITFAINKSDGVTAVSDALKQATLDNFEICRPIQVIYNFIDFERFKRNNKDHFKQAIAPQGERILIHVSNFRPVKRVDDVIYIFKIINDQTPSKLLLIGDGPERNKCEDLSRRLGLTKDIRFLGKQDAVEELLAVADVFLLPSASESFGLAALEAMACEVPVVSSNVGGIPEVNLDGVTGFTSGVGMVDKMAEDVMKIFESEETLQRFRAAALKQAERFDIDRMIPQYEAYYEKVLRASRAKPEEPVMDC
ncbi:N-acetyl-alpha-D-glucosaminyl L-malate synthase BshA [Lewinella marina]|uniref:N-acetyl-alpha-D-glucosaminyl L-malate synthase BshA n=1 Tax=Neolewinella marina TaxID=438751 RepID=A0A2G0CD92_9BACT|nr:N-acetyl-alpha-D-glucosaminyl L-malate synthase BshA [Neolewinella marina]NJB86876.1 N-acetyl-alpha-D-glucosaminyl L-malate synthase BshA [Neolewinella marina]PHK97925.1 N-acetyl-alpha-D-glucosaminyl L-malate synthase BshA [Neolewinella marina]